MISNQIHSYYDSLFRCPIDIGLDKLKTDDSVALMKHTESLARELCASAFDNLDEFPYFYTTSGITEALNYKLSSVQFTALSGEYRYAMSFPNFTRKSVDVTYFSYPFSGTGKFEAIPESKSVILDCAYMFASNMTNDKYLPNNVSDVMFSLSKSHNIADMRIGWIFSKEKFTPYQILQHEFGYLNKQHSIFIQRALEYAPNELYKRHKDAIDELYNKNKISVGDTNLFGIDQVGKRIPYYHLLNT